MPMPATPKIYHIVHVDRLPSIIAEGCLWSDVEIVRRTRSGTTIGMNSIKQRRLNALTLTSHPGLYVGACVPFYFCPRSVMLYVIHQANHPELAYRDGQESIVHLESDLHQAVSWAEQSKRRWAFTLSNAGAYYCEDRADLGQLGEIDWSAVHAQRWSGHSVPSSVKEGKQAEFLVEHSFPWELVARIGVRSQPVSMQVRAALRATDHRPQVESNPSGIIKREGRRHDPLQAWRYACRRRRSPGQYRQLRWHHGARHCPAVQKRFPREFQSLCCRVQARRGATRADVRLRDRPTDQSALCH